MTGAAIDQDARVRRECIVLGVLVLISLGLHTHTKYQLDIMVELLWICHPAALVLGLGLLFQRATWVGVGFMFHLCVGLPVFMLNFVVTGGDTTWTSFVEHWMCPIAGAWGVWRLGLPRRAYLWAWGLLIVLIGVARVATPPRLNINLAHKVYGPMKSIFPHHALYLAMNVTGALIVLFCLSWSIRWVLARYVKRRAHHEVLTDV